MTETKLDKKLVFIKQKTYDTIDDVYIDNEIFFKLEKFDICFKKLIESKKQNLSSVSIKKGNMYHLFEIERIKVSNPIPLRFTFENKDNYKFNFMVYSEP
jgi:hypothetical protein